jgi:hypothetical protein
MVAGSGAPRHGEAAQVYRRSVLAGAGIVAALALLGFARFPHITGSLILPLVEVLAALAIAAAASWLALRLLRADGTEATARHALVIAVPTIALWLAYILFTHLALKDAAKPTIGATLTWLVLGATAALAVVVGALAARGTGRTGSGAVAGWCGGVIAALFIQACLLVMLDLAMPLLARHMTFGELSAYLTSGWPDRGAWYYWNEEFFGGIGYFLTLAVLGTLAGALGGVVGRALARGPVVAGARG